MPISSTQSSISYVANGAGTAFAFPYLFYDPTEIVVLDTNPVSGLTVARVLNTDYTVTGAGLQAGGTVTMTVPPVSEDVITILRQVPLTQLLALVQDDNLPSAALQETLDLFTMADQQLQNQLNRAITIPIFDSASINVALPLAALRANKQLGFDASGNVIVNADIGVWRGAWAANTAYNYRDLIQDPVTLNVYLALAVYTSGVSLAADIAAGNLQLILNSAAATTSANASAASAATAQGAATSATASASTASAAATSATASATSASASASSAGVSATTASTAAAIANQSAAQAAQALLPIWQASTAYIPGQLVIVGTSIYLCVAAHTSGVFTTDLASGDWTGFSAIANNSITPQKLIDVYQQQAYAVASGANTYVATLTPAPLGYSVGMQVNISFANGNTGPATLNLNGLGIVPIQKYDTALLGGEILSNQVALLIYDGANFQLQNPGGTVVYAGIAVDNTGVLTINTNSGINADAFADTAMFPADVQFSIQNNQLIATY